MQEPPGLQQLLDRLSELAGGAARLCGKDGGVILSAAAGPPDNLFPGKEIVAAVNDAASGPCQVRVVDGVTVVAFRLGDNVLLLDNRRSIEDKQKFQQIIAEALPYIAQVAGGDVVLFDARGVRVSAVHPDGSPNPGALGVLNHMCQRVMSKMRPSIGPSVMALGATAVRIPLAAGYGLAFNNRFASQQRQRLLDNARQYHYARYHIEDIIGEGPAIAKAKTLARDAAKSASTVLIAGETGTGKELFAQAIHNLSARSASPFVAINCGAMPADLVESTLFGYAEGAFTGARKGGHPGAFEQANGGTLFFDEISEMPLPLQVKLLRVLQEREVTRIGDAKALEVDVRIIASTNRPLHELIKAGQFRPDLYFRLNVIELTIPPLRERLEDLLALTDFFVRKLSTMLGKRVEDITPEAMQSLAKHHWPGNVRELHNCLEYAVNIIDAGCPSIAQEHLPPAIVTDAAGGRELSLYDEHMGQAERELVLKALQLCGYNKAETARRLGLNRTTLWRILNKHKL